METSNLMICPKCGSDLTKDGYEGLCLKCLGRFGLASDADEPATLRLGDYELLEEIARGGMGVVYRARQLSLNRIVAVKVVLHGPFSSPDFVRRFRNEAEATATLRHPNIVSVYDVGEYNGHHFLSMEYVEGRNLADLVREQPLPARRAAGYVKTVAEAVHHAHQHGVLHRDLKPSNVLLDTFDQPRVTDFGLAKIIGHNAELTATGQILGSPNHIPPEQAAGKPTTAQSDIYSLGSILYQLIAGRPPFQGGTLPELLVQVQTSEPISPRQLNPSVPVDLQSICLKCLQKEPSRRYAAAQELADDLGRFLDQQPVLARPVTTAERAWLWCRRKPLLAGLGMSLAAAVMFGLGGIVWQWRRAEFHATGEKIQRLAAEENAAKTRLSLYAADVNLAGQALHDGDYGLARRTLDSLRPQAGEPDLRGFEWRYLWNLSQGNQLATLTGHKWIVTCATFSPDGKQLVTGDMEGELRVWDAARRACLRELSQDSHALWTVSFTPDGKTLMVAGTGGEVRFWDTETWQIITNIPGQMAALSKDGTMVAVSESSPFYFEQSSAVSLWNWRAGQKLRTFSQPGRALALSPDTKILAMAGPVAGITLWNTASGALLQTLSTDNPVWSLNFSPDGKGLVGAGWCGKALIWDLDAHSPPRAISVNHLNFWSVIFSPDGSTIVTTSSDQTIRLWDAATLQPKAVLHGHANEVWCAAFSPDGKILATGGKDQNVMLWQPDPGTRRETIPFENESHPLFTPGGDGLFTLLPGGTHEGTLWDTKTLGPAARFPGKGEMFVGYSENGREVAFLGSEENTLEFWLPDATDASRTVTLANAQAKAGKFVQWGMTQGMDYFFAVDEAGLARIWNAGTGLLIHSIQAPAQPIRNVVLSSDGRLLAVSLARENEVHLFDCATGGEQHLTGHKDFVSGLAFTVDSSLLATGSMDGTIRLWDTATGRQKALLPGHMQETTDVAFSPDGCTLASLSHGESLKLWHIPTLREVYSEVMQQAGGWLRFSPDGERLAVGTRENQVRLLDAQKE